MERMSYGASMCPLGWYVWGDSSQRGTSLTVLKLQHRHRDIVRHFSIKPVQTIVDFAEAQKDIGNLSADMIPSLRGRSVVPVIETSAPKKRTKAAENADMDSDRSSEDDSVKPSDKGKGRADEEDSRATSEGTTTQEEESETEELSRKRERAASSSQPGAASKRSRVGRPSSSKRIVTSGIDLGDHVFEEDTLIDSGMVPRVARRVRDSFSFGNRSDCATGLHLLRDEERGSLLRSDMAPEQDEGNGPLQWMSEG
jgi:hypothetical protein